MPLQEIIIVATYTLCIQEDFCILRLDLIWTFTLKLNVMGLLSDSKYCLQLDLIHVIHSLGNNVYEFRRYIAGIIHLCHISYYLYCVGNVLP